MRISDWSSDVCSSDLLHPGRGARPCRAARRCGAGNGRGSAGRTAGAGGLSAGAPPMSETGIIVYGVAILVLLVLSAFFLMSDTGLTAASPTCLHHLPVPSEQALPVHPQRTR